MSTTKTSSESAAETSKAGMPDFKLEVVAIPVSDVDRAKAFYQGLGLAPRRRLLRSARTFEWCS